MGTRRRYFVALGAIAIVSAIQFVILRAHTSDARIASRTVDLAGRQGVLTERISFWAGQVTATRSPLARAEAARYLAKDVDDLERNEARLASGDPSINPPGWPPPAVRALNEDPPYSTLARTADYIRHARAILAHPDSSRLSSDFLYLADRHDGLVALYERIVREYALDSERHTSQLVVEEAAAFVFVLITLVAELVLIFLPMERMIRERQERLHVRATYDQLTGLLNRSSTYEYLADLLARPAPHETAVIFVDIDNFKAVNDTLGHIGGDKLIVALAQRLRTIVGTTGVAGRPGGDEFVVLTRALRGRIAIETFAEKIRDAFRAPLTIDGRAYRPTVSVGVSRFPDDAPDMDTLLRQADTAMYAAKRAGRDTVALYEPAMEREALHWRRLSAELGNAIAAGHMFLLFQPVVCAKTGELLSVEALVRWRHHELGVLPPATFIPIAEESGAIRQLDAWVIRAACRQMQEWRSEGVPVPRVAINVSARLFDGVDLIAVLRSAIEDTGIAPTDLTIEVTEGTIVRELQTAAISLQALRSLGVEVAIDDFGTGYSSLAYLKNLPADTVKIDRRFVREFPDDDADVAIVEAVIRLAERLGLNTIAEGVENQAQAELLRDLGCRAIQGFHLGRPVGPEQIAKNACYT